jgi:hypothetical protein
MVLDELAVAVVSRVQRVFGIEALTGSLIMIKRYIKR